MKMYSGMYPLLEVFGFPGKTYETLEYMIPNPHACDMRTVGTPISAFVFLLTLKLLPDQMMIDPSVIDVLVIGVTILGSENQAKYLRCPSNKPCKLNPYVLYLIFYIIADAIGWNTIAC